MENNRNIAPAPLNLAVVGAGPVGLALAVLAAERLPEARITLWDARDSAADISQDPRTLALSLGSIQLLRRLQAWPAEVAQAIESVHVSQSAGAWGPLANAEVMISAVQERVDLLGAVLRYGPLTSALQKRWLELTQQHPQRLFTRFSSPVDHLSNVPLGVQVHASDMETFDLAVVAEGGVFAQRSTSVLGSSKRGAPLRHDYQQTAWVGQVMLKEPHRGTAYECFGREGPVALLPLKAAGQREAALVWCVKTASDPVADLQDDQRVHVLNSLVHPQVGSIESISPLKKFPLGLMAHRSLTEGRTVRIGNAAQTLHPVAGQGLNLGLRDAYSLVNALRLSGPDQALKRLEWQRGPDRWALLATTDFLARSFAWQIPGAHTLRGLGLAALERLPRVKSTLAQHMMFGLR